jgi:hypothetical protein
MHDLHPIVRDEICKFRLRVRDDGKGIDPTVLANQGGKDATVCTACRSGRATPDAVWLSRSGGDPLPFTCCGITRACFFHAQQLTQYAQTAWRFQEGVFDASPVSIAQTTDGFL